MVDVIREFLDKRNVIAVVGASRNPEKYGYKVYRALKMAGYKVYPVNPNADEILGDKCYPDLYSLPEKPDVVSLVVPPKIAEAVLHACKDLDVRRVWMQPGAESEDAIKFCNDNGIKVVYGLCIMVESGRLR